MGPSKQVSWYNWNYQVGSKSSKQRFILTQDMFTLQKSFYTKSQNTVQIHVCKT